MKLEEVMDIFGTSDKGKVKRIEFHTLVNNYHIKGWIYRNPSSFLKGALILDNIEIDGKWISINQYVQGMPKIHYLDKEWIFVKKQDINKIFITEKLDGTNITYFPILLDGEVIDIGRKTRMMPSVDEQFAILIEDTGLEKDIINIMFYNPYSFTFELYGYRNSIMIKYEHPIDMRLLGVMEWRKLHSYSNIKGYGLPAVDELFRIDGNIAYFTKGDWEPIYFTDYLDLYNRLEENLELINSTYPYPKYEGVVWNIEWDGVNHWFKNKAKTIRIEHTQAYINKEVIKEIITKLYRSYRVKLDVDELLPYVIDELVTEYGFPEYLVKIEKKRIKNKIESIISRLDTSLNEFLEEAYLSVWRYLNGDMSDLGLVMRTYAELYPQYKKYASKFYNYVLNRGVDNGH